MAAAVTAKPAKGVAKGAPPKGIRLLGTAKGIAIGRTSAIGGVSTIRGTSLLTASPLHFHQLAGSNSHHIIEAMFKGLGKAMRQAVALDPGREDEIPSSKGVL